MCKVGWMCEREEKFEMYALMRAGGCERNALTSNEWYQPGLRRDPEYVYCTRDPRNT